MATSRDSASRSSSQPLLDAQSSLIIPTTNANRDSKRGRAIHQPKGTVAYTVGNSDTLEKIALHFNSTPSALLHLNKLNSRIVFPGQILYVPEESASKTDNEKKRSDGHTSSSSPLSSKPNEEDVFIVSTDHHLSSGSSPTTAQQDVGQMVWSMTRQTAAKPGHAQRLKSDETQDNESSIRTMEERIKYQKEHNKQNIKSLQKSMSVEENQQLDEECLQRFIKLNVRLMTDDRKSVTGTLLVTPNALMFDPDVLDPLVKDFGIDQFGLIIQMDLLAGIALYEDLTIYEREATLRDEEKRQMFHSTSIKTSRQSITVPTSDDDEQIRELILSLLDRVEKEIDPTINSTNLLFDATSNMRRRLSSERQILTNEDFALLDDNNKHSLGILIDEKDIPLQESHLQNCVPLDKVNKRFGEIDELLQRQHDLYVTPHPIEIPYYLCIKTSKTINDIPSMQNKKSFDVVYGKKALEQEYWFSVPKEKVDHLYAFFLRWTPERHTESAWDDVYPNNNRTSSNRTSRSSLQTASKQNDISPVQGFVLLANEDPELTDDYVSDKNSNTSAPKPTISKTSSESDTQPKKQHYLKRQNTLLKEWEIISVDEIYRRINATHTTSAVGTIDLGIPPPKLLEPSTLISEEQSKCIVHELPPRVHGLNWRMLFSTEAHGFSLSQLYRRSTNVDSDTPSLLIVKDVEQHIFGAYVSQQLMISDGFYGTGETFLFTFHPQFRAFHWTGNNQFFIKGDVKSLGIGSGEGNYGLWLDADLYHGRTCPSKTFNNIRLSSKEDFIIASIELWTFID